MMNVPFEKHDVVRVASIGIGGRGGGQLNEMLAVEGGHPQSTPYRNLT